MEAKMVYVGIDVSRERLDIHMRWIISPRTGP